MSITKGGFRKYVGTFLNEEDAARLYDKYAICLWGREAHTNFSYKKIEILKFLKSNEEGENIEEPNNL
jgi:hypothetical protein